MALAPLSQHPKLTEVEKNSVKHGTGKWESNKKSILPIYQSYRDILNRDVKPNASAAYAINDEGNIAADSLWRFSPYGAKQITENEAKVIFTQPNHPNKSDIQHEHIEFLAIWKKKDGVGSKR